MKMSTYYMIRIPLPLPKPRHCITHCVRINHDGFDPGASALTWALCALVSWAEKHHDNKHDKLPGEWATRSYLRSSITVDERSTNDDILNQLDACGAKVRVVTCEEELDFPWAQKGRELFASHGVFEVWSTIPPAPEPGEEAGILDA